MGSFKRYLSAFLAFSMAFSQVQVKAAPTAEASTIIAKEKESIKVSRILGEDETKREKNVKHFLKEDITYEAAVYSYPIHYLKDGKWQEIDNSLVETKEGNEDTLQNKESDIKIQFAKNINNKKLINLEKDKYKLSWNMEGTKKVNAIPKTVNEMEINTSIEKSVSSNMAADKTLKSATASEQKKTKDILVDNEKKKTVMKAEASLDYKEIIPSVDLQYKLQGDMLKENIIINQKLDNAQFVFNFNMTNLIPKLQEDKSIVFYDIEDDKKAVFTMPAPFMFDSKGLVTTKIDLTLEEKDGIYKMVLTPDKEWLNSDEVVYPVTIDPAVETSLNANSIQDTFVSSNDMSDKYLNLYLRAGNTSGIGVARSYLRFELPQLKPADMIIYSELRLAPIEISNGGGYFNIHKVTQDWNPQGLNWNNKPNYDAKVEDYIQVIPNQTELDVADITRLTKEWYTTSNNYGIMIKANNESTGNVAFVSSDVSEAYIALRPKVIIHYNNNSGLEGYWDYQSQSVGRAGTGYVNDYNGNVIFTHSDTTMSGNRMPVNVGHVHNSNDAMSDVNIGYGMGWRLNYSLTITKETFSNGEFWVLTDEDGTKHYFPVVTSGTTTDLSGLNLSLVKNSGGTYTLKDKKDNVMTFNSDGTLKQIKDNNGNAMNFTYTDGRLTNIRDGASRNTVLNYEPGTGLLQSIIGPDGITVSYAYTGLQLTTILYSDGKESKYQYDSRSKLTKVINNDGRQMEYYYHVYQPYRVHTVTETHTLGSYGGELQIAYGNNVNTFTDVVRNKKTIHSFNNFGNTISIKDDDGNAKYYKYDTKDETKKNKLGVESRLQKTVINELSNHNAEISNSGWGLSSWGGAGTGEFTTDAKYMGSKSIKITKTDNLQKQFYAQGFNLQRGKTYTFSAYVKTANVTNTNGLGAAISIDHKTSTGSQLVSSEYIKGTQDWQRLQLTFTIPADAADGTGFAVLELNGESGTVYFDCMQLEEGTVANRYNLVQNGDLNGTGTVPDNWITGGTTSGDTLISSEDVAHPRSLSGKVFKMNGVYGAAKGLRQEINISGAKGDVFTVGAWARADSIPKGIFAVRVAVFTGSEVQWETFNFSNASSDWQYLSERVISKGDYWAVHVYFIYENNANSAYFDGIQFYKEEYGQSYQYDSKGNVISTEDLDKQNSTYEYNGSNDLIKSVDPKGSSFKYEYDDKHNIKRSISAENVVNAFEYDTYGNPKTATIGEGLVTLKSEATYVSNSNYLGSITDADGNKVTYGYDSKGQLTTITDPNGKVTTNTYDPNTKMLINTKKTADGQEVANSYVYDKDRLTTITHNGFNYNFVYDSFGNNTSVAIGGKNLITNILEERSGKLLKSIYGNGQAVSNDYDGNERVTAKKVTSDTTVSVWYAARIQNSAWQNYASDNTVRGDAGKGKNLEAVKIKLNNALPGMKIKYQAHVQNIGWQNWVYDDAVSGTEEQGLRMEAIRIQLEGATKGYRVEYQVYVQDIGWMDPVYDGDMAGTMGLSKRIEAIKINVAKVRYEYSYDAAGNLAAQEDYVNDTSYKYIYDAANRPAKVTDNKGNSVTYGYDLNNNINSFVDKVGQWYYGTLFNWDKDNRLKSMVYDRGAITNVNYNYDYLGRLTSKSISKEENASIISTSYDFNSGNSVGVKYQSYVVGKGRLPYVEDGVESGTTGQNAGIEALKVKLENPDGTMKIGYEAHIKNIGWVAQVYDDAKIGNEGQGNTIEAIKITLIGAPTGYHVQYQVHIQGLGWQAPNKDGEIAGTTGQGRAIEAIKINITKDGTKESSKVAAIRTPGVDEIKYTYDKNGNIATIEQAGKQIKYTYNELNELTREDNQVLGKSIKYTYDVGGNITKKTEYPYTTGTLGSATKTYNYAYNDTDWKDLLSSFDGKAITYDAIGNPLTYNGDSFTWESGRQLKTIKGTGKDISYKYNDSGIRTEKTVNGVTTKYRMLGDKVVFENNGTDSIYYTYDGNGKLVSINLNSQEYYYIRNAQGDIIALSDRNGKIVVNYTYDSWGKLISISGTEKDTVGVKNPYRYRGYRYDGETGLYYLQSRYYNPEWSRFINADTESGFMGDLISSNVFIYCKNNPVSMYDPTGKSAILAGGGLLLGAGIIVGGILLVGGIVWGVNKLIDYAIDSFSSPQVTNTSSKSTSPNVANAESVPETDTFPDNPSDLDKILNVPGKKIKDGPKTQGRDKTKWKVNKEVEVTHERHIYDTGAPLKHRDYHYHVDAPTKGYKHVRFLPGDKLPDIFK